MSSDSMDPCRDDPRAACTGAISPRLKRHVGCCHTTNVASSRAALVSKIPKRTMHQHQPPPPFITGQRNLLRIPNPIFIFKTKEASLETAPADGAVACNQDNQRAPPTGRSKNDDGCSETTAARALVSRQPALRQLPTPTTFPSLPPRKNCLSE